MNHEYIQTEEYRLAQSLMSFLFQHPEIKFDDSKPVREAADYLIEIAMNS